MAHFPLILITPSSEKKGVEFQDTSSSLSFRYEEAILRAGGLPVVAPMTTDRDVLAEAVRRADGILLTGGDDINPDLYVKKLPRKVRQTVMMPPDGGARDLRELILIDEIFEQRKPLLAICRGFQMVNVAFGREMVVDIPSQVPDALNHAGRDKAGEALTHEVPLTPGSLLSKITGKRTLRVNSSHHQGLLEPAEPFTAVARTADGIVEAMELKPGMPNGTPSLPFFLGVQFHPERLVRKHAEHQAIFSRFVEACARNGSGTRAKTQARAKRIRLQK
ncbi:MAG TPA: gamma-glutamyl-gamma-aminobutyrate hydrolase family protein [Pseudomonadales bacterium]|nr:gamma-glutamyl-gamma-aminobutyrate hydrolase family protein [Pseudomonadales bacterium]